MNGVPVDHKFLYITFIYFLVIITQTNLAGGFCSKYMDHHHHHHQLLLLQQQQQQQSMLSFFFLSKMLCSFVSSSSSFL
jgi:UDP-N-acetylmuramyl pentapeptide phosphotransferase/UDP-N-acetylglucosamine-1-phosphate transferase